MTEACVLTKTGHPVSFFSEIHSSLEKNFTSINHVTFAAMERGKDLFPRATYIMDRGYDDNKMFIKLMELGQNFVIRLTNRRKLYYKNKWVWATELCQLNFCLSICMAFLGSVEGKGPTNRLRNTIIEAADPIKKKVYFQYYRIASGIAELLKHAKEGVRLWFKTLRPDQKQMRIKFA